MADLLYLFIQAYELYLWAHLAGIN